MPRMKILNSVEREVFDWPPIFNSVERKRCIARALREGSESGKA